MTKRRKRAIKKLMGKGYSRNEAEHICLWADMPYKDLVKNDADILDNQLIQGMEALQRELENLSTTVQKMCAAMAKGAEAFVKAFRHAMEGDDNEE